MAEIHELKPVDLREAWPHEAHNFTPWLAEHLHLLGKEVNLSLELERIEAPLGEAGRVDILARQAETGAKAVIENQLDKSDDEHLLALLGYAASAEAGIVIWVAEDFSSYHCSIVAWLNRSDNTRVYAVRLLAYRVGDSLVADFRLAVGPQKSQTSSAAVGSPTWYADFYRPLVEQLRRSGLSRGAWQERWRSFETGYPSVVYATELSDGQAHAFLQAYGDDKERVYEALRQRKDAIDAELEGKAGWEGADGATGTYWVGLATAAAVEYPEGEAADTARQWLADNLLRLREVVQPHLEQVMEELGLGRAASEDSE